MCHFCSNLDSLAKSWAAVLFLASSRIQKQNKQTKKKTDHWGGKKALQLFSESLLVQYYRQLGLF